MFYYKEHKKRSRDFEMKKLIENLIILERKMIIAKIEKRKIKYLWYKLKYKIVEKKYYKNGGI